MQTQTNHIMSYTLANIQTAPSYDLLMRNGFSDLEAVAYYGTPKGERGIMFRDIKNRGEQGIIEAKIVERDTARYSIKQTIDVTQKCTPTSLLPMFMDYMNRDIVYRGKTYNMIAMGWKFEWITSKIALGRCSRRIRHNYFGDSEIYEKRIQISSWFISNSDTTYALWVDTILHEIAHAIDVEIRGKSDHSWKWKDIAYAIGCDGERTTEAKINIGATKWTSYCPNGHEAALNRKSKVIEQGRRSCGRCSKQFGTSGFNKDFILKQRQNY